MNIPETGNIKWSETVIIVDAYFLDHVAFDLIVNFERMIGRRIPQADMAQWAVCAALDGGLRPGTHETQVVLIHDAGSRMMANFAPADYEAELDGKAFDKDHMPMLTNKTLKKMEITPDGHWAVTVNLVTKDDMIPSTARSNAIREHTIFLHADGRLGICEGQCVTVIADGPDEAEAAACFERAMQRN